MLHGVFNRDLSRLRNVCGNMIMFHVIAQLARNLPTSTGRSNVVLYKCFLDVRFHCWRRENVASTLRKMQTYIIKTLIRHRNITGKSVGLPNGPILERISTSHPKVTFYGRPLSSMFHVFEMHCTVMTV